MPGVERCDSITLDPHKGLFLPYGTGCLLVQDPEALRKAHQGAAGYLQDVAAALGQVNFTDISPELSRDFRGLRVWLPLQLHGLNAFREQLREKLELTQWAGRELQEDPLFHVLDEPQLSIVAFTAAPRRGDPDAIGAEILRRVNARKRVFLSSTTLRGRYVLRICVLSFRTHLDRVKDAVTALQEEARKVEA
jgi:aromatic-L-amino-acid/L-tryptophan decarboxylase